MNRTLNKIARQTGWLPAAGWAALIFWLSSQSEPVEQDIWLPPHADKVVHMILFGVLAWLVYPFMRIIGWNELLAACVSLAIASVYGIIDEWHQSYVPNRQMDLYDWIADTLGAATVFWLRAKESRILKWITRRPASS